jgi:hypothetical protein
MHQQRMRNVSAVLRHPDRAARRLLDGTWWPYGCSWFVTMLHLNAARCVVHSQSRQGENASSNGDNFDVGHVLSMQHQRQALQPTLMCIKRNSQAADNLERDEQYGTSQPAHTGCTQLYHCFKISPSKAVDPLKAVSHGRPSSSGPAV